jgi:hypothetical protein|tara:strand:- start:1244 stop:1549 length:306 start_codon:yes stop_codon:yes gene_type:complete
MEHCIYIVGNDIELSGEKVARILDVRPTLLNQLAELLEYANQFESLLEEKENIAYDLEASDALARSEFDDGFDKGFEEGQQDSAPLESEIRENPLLKEGEG